MIRTKKIAILAIIAMVLTMMPAALFAADGDKLAGADRIATALEIADAGWTTADTVVLAPADQANLVDALAAAPLAGQEDAPILLTFKGALNANVKAKIEALGASTVYVVGAISDAVFAEVDAIDGVTAEKLSGANRWATADAINAKLVDPAGSFVVGYNSIADALSVASYAAANNFAIVLTKADGTVDESKLVGDKVYLVGGTGVVKDYADADDRFGGADRFATNAAVAAGLTFSYDKVYVAGGLNANLVDALAVAPLAAKANAFVALANGNSVAADVEASEAIAVGGVVSEAARASVLSGDLAVVSVSAINSKEIVVTFNKNVNKGSAEDEANYEIKIGGAAALDTAVYEAELDDNGKRVTILLDDAIQAITSVNVVVDEDVMDAQLNALGDDYKAAFIFYDDEAPSVVDTEVDGNELTVTFSEYVADIDLVKVDGNVMTDGVEYDLSSPVKELVIDITDLELEDGKYNVTFANVDDLQTDPNVAGYIVASFTVSDTSSAPAVASLEQTGTYTFEVEFTKALAAAPTVTAKNGGIDIVNGITQDDNTTWIVDLDTATADDLYDDGNDSFYITVTVSNYQAASNDMYGDKYTKSLKMTKDTTGPVLVSGYNKVVNDDTFQLRFNEEISIAGVAADITVVDEDGVKLEALAIGTANDSEGDTTILTITLDDDGDLAADIIEAGTYSITVAKGIVEDGDGNDNLSFTTSVKKSEAEEKVSVLGAVGSGDEIEVTYDTEMGSSAIVASNYKIDGATLPSGTSLYFTDSSKQVVLIALPSGSIVDDSDVVLEISTKVLGKDGQKLETTDLYQIVSGLTDNVKPVLTAAEKTNSSTITLEFSEDLSAFDVADFKVKVNGVEVAVTADSFSAGDDEVVLTVTNGYNTSQTVTVTVVDSPGTSTADMAGNGLTAKTSVTATK